MRRPRFHHLTGVHDNDFVRSFRHQRQVMSDEHQRHVLFLLQFQQQLDDLRLDGHIQRRRRFIGNQQLRSTGNRHRDHHALAHPTGKLMRIHVQTRGRIGDPHLVQQVNRPLTTGLLVTTLMHLDRFHNLETDGVARIQAGHRVLENHRHFGANQITALFLRNTLQVLAVEQQIFRHHAAWIINQPHNRQRTDRFS